MTTKNKDENTSIRDAAEPRVPETPTSETSPTAANLLLEQFQPMWKIVVSQFFEHRAAVVSLFVITVFLLFAISAPLISFFTGLNDERQNPLHRFAPLSTTVPVDGEEKENRFEEYLKTHAAEVPQIFAELQKNNLTTATDATEGVREVIMQEPDDALAELQKIPTAPTATLQHLIKGFNVYHWLGTDELGRDVFIRLVFGARVSMGVGILVAVSSSLLGLLIGAVAGYYGGFIDVCLMRFTDALLSLPSTADSDRDRGHRYAQSSLSGGDFWRRQSVDV